MTDFELIVRGIIEPLGGEVVQSNTGLYTAETLVAKFDHEHFNISIFLSLRVKSEHSRWTVRIGAIGGLKYGPSDFYETDNDRWIDAIRTKALNALVSSVLKK